MAFRLGQKLTPYASGFEGKWCLIQLGKLTKSKQVENLTIL